MKRLSTIVILAMMTGLAVSCKGQSGNQDQGQNGKTELEEGKVNVVYFHFARRCATCQAIEDETKKAVKEIGDGQVAFIAVNIEEESGEELAGKLGVSGQALLVVKGDEKIDLTKEGFQLARTSPDKFRGIVKEKAKSLK